MQYTITFQPEGRSARIEDHQTVLDAAEHAGVWVNRMCGGEGVCGRCKVIVRAGEVWNAPGVPLSRDEVEQGYVLACKCYPCSDLTVEVPVASRLQGKPHLTDDEVRRVNPVGQSVGDGKLYPYEPLSQKIYVSLPPPSLEDYLGDQERLFRELEQDGQVMQIGLTPLRQLSTTVRKHDWQVTATLGQRDGIVEVLQVEGGDTTGRHFGVAVDVGTTTIVAHLIDLNSLQTIGQQATYNAQIQYGEDVITRIMYANTREKLERLSASAVNDINHLIDELVKQADISLDDITYVMCAGNTTMTHLLLGLDPSGIRLEPYIPAASNPPVIRAAEVGIRINSHGLLGCVPAVASYVGGDIVADVLASGMAQSEEPSLLIDVGTNAEITVGNADWIVCCAASAGPTFEGGGISCGMRAARGAIERLTMRNAGRHVAYSVIGGGKPIGICGSGLMDTVAELFRNGCIGRNGLFISGNERLREGDDGLEFLLVDRAQTVDDRDIVITQADLANFIRSKGAIYHACDCLLERVGLEFSDIQTVYISGGFGNYLDVKKAIFIGLLPDLPEERFRFIGNGSVHGTAMMLLSRQAAAAAQKIADNMTYIELSTDHRFMNDYSSALFLPHTDIERFASVHRALARSQANG